MGQSLNALWEHAGLDAAVRAEQEAKRRRRQLAAASETATGVQFTWTYCSGSHELVKSQKISLLIIAVQLCTTPRHCQQHPAIILCPLTGWKRSIVYMRTTTVMYRCLCFVLSLQSSFRGGELIANCELAAHIRQLREEEAAAVEAEDFEAAASLSAALDAAAAAAVEAVEEARDADAAAIAATLARSDAAGQQVC